MRHSELKPHRDEGHGSSARHHSELPPADKGSTPPATAEAGRPFAARLVLPLLIAAGTLAYLPSFDAEFLFDSVLRIGENPFIRHIWPPWDWLTYSRRPVAYLTFAVNYQLHGTEVWGYHAVNLAIHIAAAWTLYGAAWRTFASGGMPARLRESARILAFAISLIWMLHPLQTQAVTYVVQRMESLMGLFVLLTLYAFIRAQDSGRPAGWYGLSVGCCWLAMLTKEVGAMAPLLVLWYDRAFVAGSWRAVSQRAGYYAALSAGWILLAIFIYLLRATFIGSVVIVKGVTSWQYALSQAGVIAHYLRLCVWPFGQCFDYAWPVATTPAEIVPPLLLIGLLAGLTVWAMFRRPKLSFLGGWFFLILAPTSSIMPIRDLAVEHRMYVPSIAVVAGVVLGGHALVTGLRTNAARKRRQGIVVGVGCAAIAGVLGYFTFQRNEVYRHPISLWGDVVEKVPHNARARGHYGAALREESRYEEARREFDIQLKLEPDTPYPYYNIGYQSALLGRHAEALRWYDKAFDRIDGHPLLAPSLHNERGISLRETGRLSEAVPHFEKAVALDPYKATYRTNLGAAYYLQGDLEAAAAWLATALRISPDESDALTNLGLIEHLSGRPRAALSHFQHALEVNPDDEKAHYNLANLYDDLGQFENALLHYRRAVELAPEWPQAHHNLGVFYYTRRGDLPRAAEHFQTALRLDPQYAQARRNLQRVLNEMESTP